MSELSRRRRSAAAAIASPRRAQPEPNGPELEAWRASVGAIDGVRARNRQETHRNVAGEEDGFGGRKWGKAKSERSCDAKKKLTEGFSSRDQQVPGDALKRERAHRDHQRRGESLRGAHRRRRRPPWSPERYKGRHEPRSKEMEAASKEKEKALTRRWLTREHRNS